MKDPFAKERQLAKCGVTLKGDYAYIYFEGLPPFKALDILREDGWIYNIDLDQWRYPGDKRTSGFNHAIKIQNAICRKCHIKYVNKVSKRL